MKELLIIRSASFQQLDQNIGAIEKRFSGYRLNILTHEHGLKLAKKYKNVDNVYLYPYVGGFSFRNKVTDFSWKEFEVVIIPVTNVSGVGFFNVLFFSLTLKAKQRFICNLISDIREINKIDIFKIGIKNFMMSCLANLITVICGGLIFVFLPAKLRMLERED